MKKNVILVGVGPHSKRVYIPWLLSKRKDIEIVAAVELATAKDDVKDYFKKLDISAEIVYTEPFKGDRLPAKLAAQLTEIATKKKVSAVIIASEPTAHIQYGLWALKNGLNILMDKPITTRPRASISIMAARKILRDFKKLEKAYVSALRSNPKLLFSVNVQRRFDPKFDKVRDLIKEVSKKTNCPVTSIQSSTADGQWRMPNEIVELNYHGFNEGYGKGSHSGYHTFDILWEFIAAGASPNKLPNRVEIISSANRPSDFFAQIAPEDYQQLFKKRSLPNLASKEELSKITRRYGEIDLFTQFVFKHNKDIICTTQSSLLHNSYSRRSWPVAKKDLYKGNGRVKQEHYFIEQGPFQALHIHSYQSFGKDAELLPYDRNGKQHFEIHIFRNSKLIGGKPYEHITAKDFKAQPGRQRTALDTELEGKVLVLEEFFDFIAGRRKRKELRSDLHLHGNTVRLMSGAYLAQILRFRLKMPLN